MSVSIDPASFRAEAEDAEAARFNAATAALLATLPDQWAFPAETVRAARRAGRGPFPFPPFSARAETFSIPGPGGDIALRLVPPASGPVRGVYLHVHGGGWTFGSADMHDPILETIADGAGVAVISVEYRLAPEHRYPAAPDDCEAAALWLARNARARFGTDRLAIGGESAGAHLALVTLQRLRDRHASAPFRAMVLTAGCYDLRLTPSVRRWGDEKLILNTRDIANFVARFVPPETPLDDPDVSPLLARLVGLPPALVGVGSRDPLLDDSLFLAAGLAAAGVETALEVTPGGCHVFQLFPLAIAARWLARCGAFLRARLEG